MTDNERAQREAENMRQAAAWPPPTAGMAEMLAQMNAEPPVSMNDAFQQVVDALTPLHDDARVRVLKAAAILLGVDLRGR